MNTAQRTLAALALAGTALGIASPAFADDNAAAAGVATSDIPTTDWHYTIMDAPEHLTIVDTAIAAAAQTVSPDLSVPADGNFTTDLLQ